MNSRLQERDAEFLVHRPKLLGIAYRMLGTMSDAEDIVQDSYLRWQESNFDVQNSGAYLRKISVNLCLDRLRMRRNSRIEYVGPWVPEPFYTSVDAGKLDDPEDLVGGLSTAFLIVLERLTPLQRAVYLLKQVIGLSHDEISELLEISVESSRTHHRRARQALSSDAESRYDVDPAEHRRLIDSFMAAVSSGDVDAMQNLLASDGTCYTDGGGKVAAASKPFSGADAVIKFLFGLRRVHTLVSLPRIVEVNGSYGIFMTDDTGDSLVTIGSKDGRLSEIFIQRNPEKLAGLRQSILASRSN